MYNRYIPQPDGSFRRSRIVETSKHPSQTPTPVMKEYSHCEAPSQRDCHTPPPNNKQRSSRPRPRSQRDEKNVTGFLRKLLPKDFDTGDLFVILLLLLMAGDCVEEKNTTLLTLALYFLM